MENSVYYFYSSRSTVNGKWKTPKQYIFNRLYYVNSGTAVIYNGKCEHRLIEGHIYLFPQCNDFEPISAENFDHTYFDFTSKTIYRPDMFTEINSSENNFDDLFKFINTLITQEKNSAALHKLLEGILDYINRRYEIPILKNNIVISAINYIHDNSSSVTTEELAKKLNINKSHFIRTFKKYIGLTPMKFIQSYRLAEGMNFINMGKSVAEAAQLCGYESPSAFCVAFKKQYGTVPSK